MPEPNRHLRTAREATPSPHVPGAAMNRHELADAVNAWLYEHTDRHGALTEDYVARLERGRVRWPGRDYRAGFRAVLHAESDAALGFRPSNRRPIRYLPVQAEPTDAEDTATTLTETWDAQAAADLAEALSAGQPGPINPLTAARLTHEWLVVPPPQTVQLRAGRRIGTGLVTTITRRVESLRHLDDYVAGGDLHAAIERELAATVRLARSGSYTDATGRVLLTAVGELAQLAGWVTADAGIDDRAVRYYVEGVRAAHAAGNAPLAGNLVSSLSYHLANTADPRDAVLLARSALAGSASTATATTRALFTERLAWAHAKSRDSQATASALGQVEDAYAARRPDEDPEWVYWLNEEEIDVMAGRCWTELHQPDQAIPRLDRALSAYDDRHTREVALYSSWLAEAHLQAGNVDAAATLALRSSELTDRTASARSEDRVRTLAAELAPYSGVTTVRAFNTAVAARPVSR